MSTERRAAPRPAGGADELPSLARLAASVGTHGAAPPAENASTTPEHTATMQLDALVTSTKEKFAASEQVPDVVPVEPVAAVDLPELEHWPEALKDTASETPAVKAGSAVKFQITPKWRRADAARLYMLYVNDSGHVRVLFPTRRHTDNHVDSTTGLVTTPPDGQSYLKFVPTSTDDVVELEAVYVAVVPEADAAQLSWLPDGLKPIRSSEELSQLTASLSNARVGKCTLLVINETAIERREAEAAAAAAAAESGSLWRLAHELCTGWHSNKNAPMGIRNVLTALDALDRLAGLRSPHLPASGAWRSTRGDDRQFSALYVLKGLTLSPRVHERLEEMRGQKNGAITMTVESFSEGTSLSSVADKINQDCFQGTGEKIPKIVDSAALEDADVVLLAAEHVERQWAEPFELEEAPGWFRVSASVGTKCRMMTVEPAANSGSRYFEGDTYEGVLLPTLHPPPPGSSPNLPKRPSSMHALLVLPKASDAEAMRKAFEEIKDTGPEKLRQVLAAPPALATVRMPLMTLELQPKDVTERCRRALPRLVDSPITGLLAPDKPLKVGVVNHSAVVKVTEKGLSAAAATAINMTRGAAPPEPKYTKRLDFDRGFHLWLLERVDVSKKAGDPGFDFQVAYYACIEDATGLSPPADSAPPAGSPQAV